MNGEGGNYGGISEKAVRRPGRHGPAPGDTALCPLPAARCPLVLDLGHQVADVLPLACRLLPKLLGPLAVAVGVHGHVGAEQDVRGRVLDEAALGQGLDDRTGEIVDAIGQVAPLATDGQLLGVHLDDDDRRLAEHDLLGRHQAGHDLPHPLPELFQVAQEQLQSPQFGFVGGVLQVGLGGLQVPFGPCKVALADRLPRHGNRATEGLPLRRIHGRLRCAAARSWAPREPACVPSARVPRGGLGFLGLGNALRRRFRQGRLLFGRGGHLGDGGSLLLRRRGLGGVGQGRWRRQFCPACWGPLRRPGDSAPTAAIRSSGGCQRS